MNILDQAPENAERIISDWIASRGLPAYRTRQIIPRLWQRPVGSWKQCSDLPKDLIGALETKFPLYRPGRKEMRESADGTVKYLWEMRNGATVESVVIPEGRRKTVCISSQAGCAFGCSFCATGKMGFIRNLEPWEITAQVRELAIAESGESVGNVVFMGMGEPLHNWVSVDVALSILNDARGMGIGARRICVSTVGIVPKLKKLARRPEQFRLAVSLHSPFGERRSQLMPVERSSPLADVLGALRDFSRRITFEYALIKGFNDRGVDLEELAAIAKPIGALVNLLPLHPVGEERFRSPSHREVEDFASGLRSRGVKVSVRRSRGLDINAACGQLWSDVVRSGNVASKQDRDIQ